MFIDLSVFENMLWVEKYRPKCLNDMILSDEYRSIFTEFVNNKYIPNLLLHGGPGSGKSCMARILTDSVPTDKSDVLYSNGSSINGKDYVTDVIEEFVSTPSFDGKLKIVYIGEADRLTPQAQDALKEPTEIYSSNARFIFTCNELYRLSEPLRSRFHIYEFKSPDKKYVKEYILKILNSEKIEYTEESVDYIIDLNYPDIRFIINTISSRVVNKKLSTIVEDIKCSENSIIDYTKNIILDVEHNKSKKINENIKSVEDILSKNEIDFVSVYTDLFYDKTIPMWAKPVINDYCNRSRTALFGPMHFMSFIYSTIRSGVELKRSIGNN